MLSSAYPTCSHRDSRTEARPFGCTVTRLLQGAAVAAKTR